LHALPELKRKQMTAKEMQSMTNPRHTGTQPESDRSKANTTRFGSSRLHRHNRLLTFVGALIVFTTFVVKEGLRERLKDFVDSVGAADSTFMIRGDTNISNSLLRSLEEDIGDVERNKAIRETGIVAPSSVHLYYSWRDLSMMGQSIKANLDNVARLMRKLPNQGANIAQLETLKKALEDDGRSLDNLYKALPINPGYRLLFPEKDIIKRMSEQDLQAFDALRKHFHSLESDANRFATEVLNISEGLRDKNERSYGIYTWVSYGLYTLGWGLGLVGRLYSVEGLPAGE
jgi:hypothetical protein